MRVSQNGGPAFVLKWILGGPYLQKHPYDQPLTSTTVNIDSEPTRKSHIAMAQQLVSVDGFELIRDCVIQGGFVKCEEACC